MCFALEAVDADLKVISFYDTYVRIFVFFNFIKIVTLLKHSQLVDVKKIYLMIKVPNV